LAQRVLHTVEADRKVAGIGLGDAAGRGLLRGNLTLLSLLLAAIEQIVEKVSRRTAFLRDRCARRHPR
jgi:hypothetical protein